MLAPQSPHHHSPTVHTYLYFPSVDNYIRIGCAAFAFACDDPSFTLLID